MLEVTLQFSTCLLELQPRISALSRSHLPELLTPESFTDLENSSSVTGAHFLILYVNISSLGRYAKWAEPGARAWDGCALKQVIAWVGLEDSQKEKLQAEERWESVLLCSATNPTQTACSLYVQNSLGSLAWVAKAWGSGESAP